MGTCGAEGVQGDEAIRLVVTPHQHPVSESDDPDF